MLDYLGIVPDTVITGHKDNPDIKVAQKLAHRLDSKLTVISPEKRENDWLKKGVVFLDGMYDAVLSYRHYKKGQWTTENGYKYEFGGVAGEFYKNQFCHPFRWRFPKNNLNDEFYYDKLLNKSIMSGRWCGDALIKADKDCRKMLLEIAKLGESEHGLLIGANRVGYELLRNGSGAITNGYASVCTKIDPLMDRNLVAAVSKSNPIKLSMAMWQRKQVSHFCKKISKIKTDQGITVSINVVLLSCDCIKMLLKYAILALLRQLNEKHYINILIR